MKSQELFLDFFSNYKNEKSLSSTNSPFTTFLLLTGSHNLLNYAIICLSDKQTTI